MSIEDSSYGDQLSPGEMNGIVFEWAEVARTSHIETGSLLPQIIEANLSGTVINTDPTLFTLNANNNGVASVELKTPIFPEDFGTELLEEPKQCYLDNLIAYACSHMTTLELMGGITPSSAGRIQLNNDLEDMARQTWLIRTAQKANGKHLDHTLHPLASGLRRVSLITTTDPEHFNIGIRSGFLSLSADRHEPAIAG